MYKLEVFDSIKMINKESWDSILGNNKIICSYDFLKAVEESDINDCVYKYLIVYDNDDNIIAHTCIYTMSMDLLVLSKKIIKIIIGIIRKFYKNFLIIKILECAPPIVIGNSIIIKKNNAKEKINILNLIIDTIINISIKENSNFIIIRDFYKKDFKFNKILLNRKFNYATNMPNIVMKIKWNSFNDYINTLRYNYRRFVKKCLAAINNNKVKIKIINDFKEYVPQIRKLYFNCYENAKEFKREILTEDFFYKTNEYLKEKSIIITLEDNYNNLIGFSFLILDGNIARLLYVGMDYQVKDKYLTYFNIFYQSLKYAIENGFKELELGVTTYEFKLKMGGEIVSLYAYFKHNNKFINQLFKLLNRFIFPEIKIPKRTPFK